MKTIEIEKIETLNDIDCDDAHWKFDIVNYILTSLTALPSGCIMAEWLPMASHVTWFYTTTPYISLKPESFEGEILTIDNIIDFRIILGALGMTTLEEGYLGAGTFKVRFKNECEDSKFLAIVFSNKRETGHWIKLYVIGDEVEK